MTTSLQARIGPLGQLYDAPFQPDVPAAERFGKVLDFVTGHGFPVYGLTTKTHIHSSHLPIFAECARQAHLEVHYLAHTHPLDAPPFRDGHRLHASTAVQVRRLQHARLGEMASFTLVPPKATACTLDELEAEVGAVRDQADGTHVRVMNGPSGHLLANVEALLDFCHGAGVEPTVNVSNDYLATGAVRDEDQWSTVLNRIPAGSLFCYANYRVKPGMAPKITIYNDDSDASPPIRPLLSAALTKNLHPIILVQGDRPEADALGVLRAQAALEGADMAGLQGNLRLTRLHRRVATLAAETVPS
jgi:hypothetical protein